MTIAPASTRYIQLSPIQELPSPRKTTGAWAWIRANLFSSWLNGILTIICALIVIWFLPPIGTWVLGAVVLTLAFTEYAGLARRLSAGAPFFISGVATLCLYAAIATDIPLAPVLVTTMLVLGMIAVGRGRPEDDVLREIAVAAFPVLYLGLSLALALSVREL